MGPAVAVEGLSEAEAGSVSNNQMGVICLAPTSRLS